MWRSTSTTIFLFLSGTALCLGCLSFYREPAKQGAAYYVDPESGNDANDGLDEDRAWKTLTKVGDIGLQAGDQVWLASGAVFTEPLVLKDLQGTSKDPIVISGMSGTANAMPRIHTAGALQAVELENCSFVEIKNLSLSAGPGSYVTPTDYPEMRCGIKVHATMPGIFEHIVLENLQVANVFYEQPGFERPSGEVTTANGTQNYGWGIRFINRTNGAVIKDIKVTGCTVENVAHTGIKFTASSQGSDYGIQGIEVSNTRVLRTGGPGIQMSGVTEGHIFDNTVDRSGSTDDPRKWGRGSGLWTWGSSRVLIEKNRFTNANGPADSAGAHIDFNCRDVILQYNFSANNAGGFCEILGNNYNCSYRYNISVNDGHRIKGKGGAFQEGKTLWLSGYNSGKRKGPFQSYIYNNTIYLPKEISAKIAIDRVANGVLIANNIFQIEGEAVTVKGDQYNPETEGEWLVADVFFSNNLFLHNASWPNDQRLQDRAPYFGDAGFSFPGGLNPADYLPARTDLIKDRGVLVPVLPNDNTGLYLGLRVESDILGNPIKGLPDLGAIELK